MGNLIKWTGERFELWEFRFRDENESQIRNVQFPSRTSVPQSRARISASANPSEFRQVIRLEAELF